MCFSITFNLIVDTLPKIRALTILTDLQTELRVQTLAEFQEQQGEQSNH